VDTQHPPTATPPLAPSPRRRFDLDPKVAVTGLAVSVTVLLAVIGLSVLRGGADDLAAAPSPAGTPITSLTPDRSGSPPPSAAVSGSPGPTAAPTQIANPTAVATAAPPEVSVSFPVRGYGGVLMTQGPKGGVYFAVQGVDRTLLGLVGTNGSVQPGWPIPLETTWCMELLTAADGTLRAVCDGTREGDGLQAPVLRVFGIDAAGQTLPGWPVDIEGSAHVFGAPIARMMGSNMVLALRQYGGDALPEGQTEPTQLALIDSAGRVQMGTAVDLECCQAGAVPGPGAGFLVEPDYDAQSSRITKFGLDGVVWETVLDGIASLPSFDTAGNAYLSVWRGELIVSARLVVLDPAGRVAHESPEDLPVRPTSGWSGAGGESPAAPIVAEDGFSFVVGYKDGMSILALDREGRPRAGWPFDSGVNIGQQGVCSSADTGCGTFDVRPQVGLDGILYVTAQAGENGGGSLLAIRPDGTESPGWPVGLRNGAAQFWDVIVGSDGGVWAHAAEPERPEAYSATLLSITPDSTVRGRLTIVEP